MKVLVIFTGGTIGSSVQGEYIGTSEETKYELLRLYQNSEDAVNVEFDTVSPYTLLSENLDGNHLNQLVGCVQRALHGMLSLQKSDSTENSTMQYDGIIVTHGTDTLQYSAAALSMTTSPNIPVVLVSSNYVLTDNRANGLTNFLEAVRFIATGTAGVFVSYCNQGSAPQIWNGDSLLPHQAFSDSLYGMTGITENQSNCNSTINSACESNLADQPCIDTPSNFSLKTKFEDTLLTNECPVLYLKATPGMCYPSLTETTKAVLLETYHSGTLCTAGTSLSDFVLEAKKLDIPIYVIGMEDRVQYESTKEYEQLGLHILPKCSPIYAYMKLWYMLSNPVG